MPDARVSNTITGRDAFLRVLSDEGVTKMFGNPGTTELPIMHALSSAPEMGYVLGLQEAVVICMADGYARASGKLVSCNVHVAPGLGIDDLGRQARLERRNRRRPLAVAEDMMDRDVLAAAGDELLAAMRDHERDVGEPALQRREFDRGLPAGEPCDPFFQLRHHFLSQRGDVIISRRARPRYFAPSREENRCPTRASRTPSPAAMPFFAC